MRYRQSRTNGFKSPAREEAQMSWTIWWDLHRRVGSEGWNRAVESNEEDALLRAERFLKLGFVVYAIKDPKSAVFMDEVQISEHFVAHAPAETGLGRRSQPEARGDGAAPAGIGGAAQIHAGGNAAAQTTNRIAELGNIMARKKQPLENDFVLFNVTYEDGTLTSNRKVPSSEINQFDAEASARASIEVQDRKTETMSGRSRGPIKAIVRADAR